MGEQKQLKTKNHKPTAATSKNSPRKLATQDSRPHTDKQSVFAAGLSFKKLFFIFIIGSVFGAIYEDILIYCETWLTTGTGVWMLHRGVIYGPFNVIYGFGAALMCWVLLRKKYTNWEIFGISALLGGVVEFTLSFLQELVIGTTSWDYHSHFLNIQGRTSIPIMLVWGVMGLILVKVAYPACSKLVELIPPRFGNILFWTLLVLLSLDCLVSWTALIRQTCRHHNIPAFTPVGEFYDSYYTDDFLRHYFPNMASTEKQT